MSSTAPGSAWSPTEIPWSWCVRSASRSEAGYEITDEGETSVDLEGEDGIRVSARQSRADPEQVTVEVSTDCVDGTRDDVPSLEPEPIDVS